jgi:hypothetical protein
VHFSIAALMENRQGISDQLKAGHYAGPALVPATPWLGNAGPGTPTVSVSAGARSIKLVPGKDNAHYAIWSRQGGVWRFAVAPVSMMEWNVPEGASAVVVSAVDRLGVEGERLSVWRADHVATAP